MHGGADGATQLIAGAALNVAALATATALSIYRPGKQRRTRSADRAG